MNTNIADCSGTPFSFHAEYSTASQQNVVPWTALSAGVLMQQEIGHFEPCSSVTSAFPVNNSYAGGHTFSDPSAAQVCQGGFEGASSAGEGPCSQTSGACPGASTEGGGACPTNNFATGANCEFSDALCLPAGARNIITDGVTRQVSWRIAGCQTNIFQNGDLDFDGASYSTGWPDGTPGHPKPFAYFGPFDSLLRNYPTIQFETDLPGSEISCNVATGAGCTVPPVGRNGPTFYPFWTIGVDKLHSNGNGQGVQVCVWNFGNVIQSVTTQNFGGVAQYGTPDVTRFGGTAISPPLPNPQFSAACPNPGGNFLLSMLAGT
jgi:hypothetical protein